MKVDVADAKTVIEETRKAREALEAKGAFTEANAATHVILALEAFIRLVDLETNVLLNESFNRGLNN